MKKEYNTSPFGVILIMLLTMLLSSVFTKMYFKQDIKTKYKTEVKTNIKTVHHTDTVYITQNAHISHVTRPINQDDSLLITQSFKLTDASINANLITVAKDSVLSIDLDYTYNNTVITNTDTIFVTNTITNTIENTIQEQPKTKIFIGAVFNASKNNWLTGPTVTIDLKRKLLISANLMYQSNTGLYYGGGISIPINKK